MIKHYLIVLILICFTLPDRSQAQIWPFRKKSQVEKATKDLEKRKQEAGEGNQFNRLQPFGQSRENMRDDYIWSAATAATSYPHAGNISVTTPARYGIKQGLELSTIPILNYWAPNIFVKNEISRGKIWVSSLHGVYTSWPGLKMVYNEKNFLLADSVSNVPRVVSFRNQIIFSKPFFNKLSCYPHQPNLILSASLALDFGIPFDDEEIYLEDNLFKTPRSMSYEGTGWFGTFSFRADWHMLTQLYGRGEIRLLTGNFPTNLTLEQQSSIEYFPLNNLSISAGYILGVGNIGPNSLKLLPFLDIAFYFGKKQDRQRGLFKQQMF